MSELRVHCFGVSLDGFGAGAKENTITIPFIGGSIRMDNVLTVVDDLEAAKAFFLHFGMELEGSEPAKRCINRSATVLKWRCRSSLN